MFLKNISSSGNFYENLFIGIHYLFIFLRGAKIIFLQIVSISLEILTVSVKLQKLYTNVRISVSFELRNVIGFRRGVIICGFMVYTVKDLYVDLMWIYYDL